MISVSVVMVTAVTVVQVMRMASAFVSWASGTRGCLVGGRLLVQFGGDDIRVGHHGLHCGQRCTFGVR